MNKPSVSPFAKKAMQATLSETAQLSDEAASEYLSAVATTAISMLRSIDGEPFVYGFLRQELASLGQEADLVDNPFGGSVGVSAPRNASRVNPDLLTAVEDLRKELHNVNEQLIDRDIQLADQKVVLSQVFQDIAPILIAHTAGQTDQVKGLLDEFCSQHLVVKHTTYPLH